MPADADITQLLVAWSNGDAEAFDRLEPAVHHELHRLASRYMAGERPGHVLQTTALLNEAYMRLVDWKDVRWQNRAHFFGLAATMMRRILVDAARTSGRAKRGAGAVHVSLSEAADVPATNNLDLLALDDALTALDRLNPRHSRVVELRFFAGLSFEEKAHVLGVSARYRSTRLEPGAGMAVSRAESDQGTVTPEQYERAGGYFHAALAVPVEHRSAFLVSACAGEDELRQEVESLLAAHDGAGLFIERPTMEAGPAAFISAHGRTIEPPNRIGRYEIIALIGRGGMGEVYRARDATLGRDIALKLLRSTSLADADAVRRFEREARAASLAEPPEHPHRPRDWRGRRPAIHRHGARRGA